MSVDRQPRDYSIKPAQRSRWHLAPAWLLRMKIRWLDAEVDRLERELGAEFATLDTAPLHAELQAVTARRDALRALLAER